MASSNTSLKVSDLDFFSIKNNLKEYLRSQKEFSDYDFDGSGMSVLLDILAYNTYYNSFYLNMAANEAFLDTAQLRHNILSHAKVINYVPMSKRAAEARINIKVTPDDSEDQDQTYLTLDKYTQFLGSDKKGNRLPFVTVNSNNATKISGSFTFPNVVIKQGEVITTQFAVDANNHLRRYELPSSNVDTSTVTVRVQESVSNTFTETYTLADDLTEITSNSRVFFIEENENLTYTLYFGDGIIGKKPANGNIIITSYIDTLGSMANNLKNFAIVGLVGDKFKNNITITTAQGASGGTEKETIDQIRFRAPNFYTSQNRAVTVNDYESLITHDYNNIESVSVWGGEDNDPIVYGKVYMSLKTKNYYTLTNLEKEIIKRDLITIIPEIVDPNYCYILLQGKITYNPNLTANTSGQLKDIVRSAILDYNEKELNTFKSTFKKSRLQFYIDTCESSITGSELDVYLQKQVPIEFNKAKRYEVTFDTPIQKGTIGDKLYTFPEIIVADVDRQRAVYLEEVPEAFTGIDGIDVITPGRNFDSIPTITINGDGSGATAEATVVNGRIVSIEVTNRGVNYNQATINIGGPGIEATAVARLESRFGRLRSYYYKSNGEKIIVNDNVGSIDYDKGKVIIENIVPLSLVKNSFYDSNILTVNVLPNNDMIYPLRNRILTIDPNINKSIAIDMVAES